MIKIRKSPTADTRTCDFKKVTKEQLLDASVQHIDDVREGLAFFAQMLYRAGAMHDVDKITAIDGFHTDFRTGFKRTAWWDRHRSLNRHHLTMPDGVPADVNLIDVLDYIVDCTMAGKARSGTVTPLAIDDDVLMRAFRNTADLLAKVVAVEPDAPQPDAGMPVRPEPGDSFSFTRLEDWQEANKVANSVGLMGDVTEHVLSPWRVKGVWAKVVGVESESTIELVMADRPE